MLASDASRARAVPSPADPLLAVPGLLYLEADTLRSSRPQEGKTLDKC